jgi:hypothetical protein
MTLVNTYVPDLIFLDMRDWESALAAATDIRAFAPHSAIVGFGAGWASSQEAKSRSSTRSISGGRRPRTAFFLWLQSVLEQWTRSLKATA